MDEQTQNTAPVAEITPEAVSTEPQVQDTQSEVSSQQADTTTQNFDPNQLTDPNLQAAYKSMQADYTRKMQEFSTQRQQFEQAVKQYQPIIEALQGNQSQQQQSPELQGLESQMREAGYDNDSIKAMKMGADFILKHFNQQQAETQEVNRISSGIEKAGSVDPRLNDPKLTYDYGEGKATFGQIVEEIVAADPNWRQDPVAATQKAVKKVDAMINSAKQTGKEELSQQAKQKAQAFPQTNSSPQGAVDTGGIRSVEDAAKLALKQLGIS